MPTTQKDIRLTIVSPIFVNGSLDDGIASNMEQEALNVEFSKSTKTKKGNTFEEAFFKNGNSSK